MIMMNGMMIPPVGAHVDVKVVGEMIDVEC
jgi:hypothetical protein